MNNQYGDLTLTTAQIQERLNLVPEHSQALAALQQAITAFVTSEQVQTLIGAALADYPTTAEMNTAINNAIASALTSYYTKTAIDTLLGNKVDKVSGKQLSTEDFTTALKNKLSGLPDSTALATQINQAISTALQSYSTTTQMNNAISTAITNALTSYYTKTQVDSLVSGYNARILFIEEGIGKYDTINQITLSRAKDGKYVNTNGTETSASGYGISNPITLNVGDILLVPSASAVPATVSVVSRQVTRSYEKVIIYTYTEDEETGRYLTATADYDPNLVYSAIYDGQGVFQYWIRNGVQYDELPLTHPVTESYYEPLVKQAVSAMPSTGYYVYLCSQTMSVVISGYTATVNGGVAKIVGIGIFKNICTNFVGAPGQSVLAQALSMLYAMHEGQKKQLDDLGETRAKCIDFDDMPKVCGQPLVIEGEGTPTVPPMFKGQRYHNTTDKKCYEAFAVTNNVNDWVLLN